MAADLNLVVTEDRVQDMDLETFYHIGDSKSPKSTIDFVAHFVVDEDGNYPEKKEAIAMVVAGRKISDIEEIMEQLTKAMEEMAVPKE